MKKFLYNLLFPRTKTMEQAIRELQSEFNTEDVSLGCNICHYDFRESSTLNTHFTLHIGGQCATGDSIESCVKQMKIKLSSFSSEPENILLEN